MVLLGFVHPGAYGLKIIYLLIGCVILGFGVYMEVLANVAMLPGESFVRAVSTTWNTNFGNTKVAFDVSLTVIAAALSFLFVHRLEASGREPSLLLCWWVSPPDFWADTWPS